MTLILKAETKAGIKVEINNLLATGKACQDIPLILPASGNAYRFRYKGFTVRVWEIPDRILKRSRIYDTAVEVLG